MSRLLETKELELRAILYIVDREHFTIKCDQNCLHRKGQTCDMKISRVCSRILLVSFNLKIKF